MFLTLVIVLIYFGVVGVTLAGMWQVFVKAGRPGWEAIIPVYNIWILVTEIEKPGADKNVLHLVLMLIPCVSFVGVVIVGQGVAQRFGKDSSFGFLALLPFVFYPILGLGDAQYNGA